MCHMKIIVIMYGMKHVVHDFEAKHKSELKKYNYPTIKSKDEQKKININRHFKDNKRHIYFNNSTLDTPQQHLACLIVRQTHKHLVQPVHLLSTVHMHHP